MNATCLRCCSNDFYFVQCLFLPSVRVLDKKKGALDGELFDPFPPPKKKQKKREEKRKSRRSLYFSLTGAYGPCLALKYRL